MRRAFAVDVSAMNKELNKCMIFGLKHIELKISLSQSGHPLYFDNQATTALDPR
jgi:hypothetical protein